jgi:hypothetical protein
VCGEIIIKGRQKECKKIFFPRAQREKNRAKAKSYRDKYPVPDIFTTRAKRPAARFSKRNPFLPQMVRLGQEKS